METVPARIVVYALLFEKLQAPYCVIFLFEFSNLTACQKQTKKPLSLPNYNLRMVKSVHTLNKQLRIVISFSFMVNIFSLLFALMKINNIK